MRITTQTSLSMQHSPWKSKTKQRMVFRMIHVKDSLLPRGKVWSLYFLGSCNQLLGSFCSIYLKGFFGPSILSMGGSRKIQVENIVWWRFTTYGSPFRLFMQLIQQLKACVIPTKCWHRIPKLPKVFRKNHHLLPSVQEKNRLPKTSL